jgi:hypothetical protein
MKHNKMDEEKGPKENIKSGFVISGWPPKRWNVSQPYFERV